MELGQGGQVGHQANEAQQCWGVASAFVDDAYAGAWLALLELCHEPEEEGRYALAMSEQALRKHRCLEGGRGTGGAALQPGCMLH